MPASEVLERLLKKLGARRATALLIRAGVSPVEISSLRKVSLQTTFGYIDQAIGAGLLRRSDVLFTIPLSVRGYIDGTEDLPEDVDQETFQVDHEDEAAVVGRYGATAYALGEMYEDLCAIEVRLHQLAKDTLIKGLGPGERGWWRRGIPAPIRKECQARREEDSEPEFDAYAYTDLLDLGEVIKVNWVLFQTALPSRYQKRFKDLKADLLRLNGIRRRVMHPVRQPRLEEGDFRFTRELRSILIPGEGIAPEVQANLSDLKAMILSQRSDT